MIYRERLKQNITASSFSVSIGNGCAPHVGAENLGHKNQRHYIYLGPDDIKFSNAIEFSYGSVITFRNWLAVNK